MALFGCISLICGAEVVIPNWKEHFGGVFEEYHRYTCIKFVPWSGQKNHIVFEYTAGYVSSMNTHPGMIHA